MPAALYSAFAAELVRGRTFRRRYLPERSSPAGVLSSVNTILHQRQLEEYYCTLCYAIFDLKRRTMTLANSGLPYPIRCSSEGCAQIELPGVPLGSFHGSTYDEVTFALQPGDVFVFCTDGVFEAMNGLGQEFTAARLLEVVARSPRSAAHEDRRGDLRGRCGVARRHAAERRHDRRRRADHGLARRPRRSAAVEVDAGLLDVHADAPGRPSIATSSTLPVTRTCAPRDGTRPFCDTTVTSPVPSSTL